MKSLRVFLSVIVITISLLGGFSHIEKSYAVVNDKQPVTILSFYDPTNAKVFSTYTSGQKLEYTLNYRKLVEITRDRFTALQKTQDDAGYTADVLGIFGEYLEVKKKSPSEDVKKVATDMEALTTYLKGENTLSEASQGRLAGLGFGTGEVASAQSQLDNARASVAVAQLQGAATTEVCEFLPGAGKSFSITACINEGVIWLIKNTLLEIAGFLVWASANMFNYAIQIGILQFSDWAPASLFPIWTVVRQIVSLVIVFIGLYLGFLYILGKDEKFGKYMAWIIVFAVFVNFSYPLTRVIIDLSNIISLNIYASVVGDGALQATITSQTTAGAIIMAKLGLQGLVTAATSVTDAKTAGAGMVSSINSVPAALLTVVYVLYAGYIFLMMTAIVAMRTIALVMLIIVSPLLLVDGILPVLGDKAKELREIFFRQIVVAPVFMIMLALTMKFLDVFSVASVGGTSLTSAVNSNGDITIKVFFNILMMLVMLHVMFSVVKKVSGEFGKFATEFAGKVGGFAMGSTYGAALGGAGFLGRQTIGGAAEKLSKNKWVNSGSFLGNRVLELSNSVANRSFDLRNSKYIAGKANALGLSSGMGAGVVKDGYRGVTEAKTKDALSKADRIKTRYERDQYDANGNLIAKKGDIDPEAVRARDALLRNAGGSRFQTKDQNQKITDELIEKQTKEDKARYDEIKDKFNADGTKVTAEQQKQELYDDLNKQLDAIKVNDPDLESPEGRALKERVGALNIIRSEERQKKAIEEFGKISGQGAEAKNKRAQAIANVKKEIETLKEKDPTLSGKEAQTLLKTVDTLQQQKIEKEKAFEKELEDIKAKYDRYNDKKEAEKYLQSLSNEHFDVITERLGLKISRNASTIVDQNGAPIQKEQPVTQTGSWKVTDASSFDAQIPAVQRKQQFEQAQRVAQTATSSTSVSQPTPSIIVDQNGKSFSSTQHTQTTEKYDAKDIKTKSFTQSAAARRVDRQKEAISAIYGTTQTSDVPKTGSDHNDQSPDDSSSVNSSGPIKPSSPSSSGARVLETV